MGIMGIMGQFGNYFQDFPSMVLWFRHFHDISTFPSFISQFRWKIPPWWWNRPVVPASQAEWSPEKHHLFPAEAQWIMSWSHGAVMGIFHVISYDFIYEIYGFVWKCCVPQKTQWLMMVLLIIIPTFYGYFFGGIPHFQTYQYDLIIKFLPNHLQMQILRVPERRSQQVCWRNHQWGLSDNPIPLILHTPHMDPQVMKRPSTKSVFRLEDT